MSLDIGFNEERFVKLLTKLIGETKYLQDNPPRFIPEEDRLIWLLISDRFLNTF